MAVARFLAGTSALARLHQPRVAFFLAPLLEHGLVASCALVDLELLYSCRFATECDEVLEERRAFEQLNLEPVDWSRAWTGNGRELLDGRPRAAVVGLWWD